ncbi:MAG: hypothetical protein F2701_07365 [Actinobacteria bacterium]|uniref:Unannotated protein n=1 Tax=freshwater metagenome TaxID=449393 RepID=A0A6J6ULK3_9ZZZZ|nr:hypothetical protein [Actinomycetota bacterium]
MSDPVDETAQVPWSVRAPQKWVFSLIALLITIAIVVSAITSIAKDIGGLPPYLMLFVGPILGGFYVWYFALKKW